MDTQTAGSLSTVGTFAHTQPVSGNESAPFTIGLTSGSPIVSGGRCSGVGAWTRALSSTEISNWWNGGNGLNVI